MHSSNLQIQPQSSCNGEAQTDESIIKVPNNLSTANSTHSSNLQIQTQSSCNGEAQTDESIIKVPNNLNTYKQIISTLPKTKGCWSLGGDLYQYQGFWCYPFHLEGIMATQDHFKAQPTDIILTSAPKTGTTWLKALAFAIVTRTQFDDSTTPLLTNVPHQCVPFMEVDLAENPSNRDMGLPLVATHVPYGSLPKSITHSGCKIVYICRDPKDAFVSLWHFVERLPRAGECGSQTLEETFELYCKGLVNYGPYWDHVVGYWKASLEFPDKILFLRYEEMKKDPCFNVKRLAKFMGCPFSAEEEGDGVVEKVVKMTSFEKLSELEVNKSGEHVQRRVLKIENKVYFREGKVGDWENHLTAEMGGRLDKIMEEKLKGSSLTIATTSQKPEVVFAGV